MPTMPILTGTKAFTGSFDGGSFTISNLKINSDEFPAMGLFGYVASGAVLKNINLKDVEITSTYDPETACVGALAGYNAGTIQNCTVSGIVSGIVGSSIGGIAGKNEGTIEAVPIMPLAENFITTSNLLSHRKKHLIRSVMRA